MPVRTRLRRAAAIAAVPLVLGMSGCVRVDATVKIRNQSNVSVDLDVAASKEAYRQASGGKELGKTSVCDQMPPTAGRRTAYDRKGYVGCRIEQRGSTDDLGSNLKLEASADVYRLELHPGPLMMQTMADPKAKIDEFSVTVEFPGKVTEHNGAATVRGNKVTWTDQRDYFAADGLRATGGATNPADAALPWVLGGCGAVLVGAGIFVATRK